MSSIQWESAATAARLAEAARLDPELLFSLDARLRTLPDSTDVARDEFHEAVLQLVEAGSAALSCWPRQASVLGALSSGSSSGSYPIA